MCPGKPLPPLSSPPSHASPALAVYNQVVQQKTNELVRAEVIPASIHSAHAVGVPVGHQADVMRMLSQERGAASIILFNRLRIDAAEKSIMLSIKGCHSATRTLQ